jgi:hypothetical protein
VDLIQLAQDRKPTGRFFNDTRQYTARLRRWHFNKQQDSLFSNTKEIKTFRTQNGFLERKTSYTGLKHVHRMKDHRCPNQISKYHLTGILRLGRHLKRLLLVDVMSGLASRVTLTDARVYNMRMDLLLISFLYRSTWLLLGCVLNGTLCSYTCADARDITGQEALLTLCETLIALAFTWASDLRNGYRSAPRQWLHAIQRSFDPLMRLAFWYGMYNEDMGYLWPSTRLPDFLFPFVSGIISIFIGEETEWKSKVTTF